MGIAEILPGKERRMDFAGFCKEGISGLTPVGVPFGIPAGVIFFGKHPAELRFKSPYSEGTHQTGGERADIFFVLYPLKTAPKSPYSEEAFL